MLDNTPGPNCLRPRSCPRPRAWLGNPTCCSVVWSTWAGVYLQVGLTGQQLWGLPRKGPRNSTKSRWGTPPLFPLDGKHGLAQAHRAPPWAAHHGVHSRHPRARCSTKGPSPRDSGRRWHRSAGFQRPGAGEAEQDKAPQAPRARSGHTRRVAFPS